jgi:hypothetical protein
MAEPLKPRQDEEPIIQRWPGSGKTAAGAVVLYGGSTRWLCLADTCGKPMSGSPFWRRLDVNEPSNGRDL